MNFVFKVDVDEILIPLTQPERLWAHEKFIREWPLVVFVTGWNTNYNHTINPALDTVYAAYRTRGGANFVVSVYHHIRRFHWLWRLIVSI